ncbi:hypothetical protein DNHGIG_02030 [Collibacillus ludicampi]|uniref:Uncharacterized protein n=1 Tax=Collibacillus ludicampi TaxID=2771369 RepID=A0AAV4L9Z5_9BACL|nr:hypothetical protein [Collibacillus ludicampi]GIM44654.1 hypothetical protein DNHGIG_02030 [Collibacillus ludicampi]
MHADEDMCFFDSRGKEEAEDMVVDYLMGEKELEKLIHHFAYTADDVPDGHSHRRNGNDPQ